LKSIRAPESDQAEPPQKGRLTVDPAGAHRPKTTTTPPSSSRRFSHGPESQAKWPADGNEAAALLEEFVPDLVLLDLGLPGMDGPPDDRVHPGPPTAQENPDRQSSAYVDLIHEVRHLWRGSLPHEADQPGRAGTDRERAARQVTAGRSQGKQMTPVV
jgi:hypothetical protein